MRSWTHLERQRGGFGFLGGPGETQIETDRRMIEERIARIEARARRGQAHPHAASRQPQARAVSDRGAGRLHQCRQIDAVQRADQASVLSADMLFATLDPTLRAVEAAARRPQVILSDTVGFISDLPTMLVAAFRATLEEVLEADVILHVRDISHEETEAQAQRRRRSAARARHRSGGPRAADRGLEQDRPPRCRRRARGMHNIAERQPPDRRPVLVSALTGEGQDPLIATIEARLSASRVTSISCSTADGAGVSWLHRNTGGAVRQTRG